MLAEVFGEHSADRDPLQESKKTCLAIKKTVVKGVECNATVPSLAANPEHYATHLQELV